MTKVKLENNILYWMWNYPLGMWDIDVPDEGHQLPCWTFSSKEEITETLPEMLTINGVRMRGEAYETRGSVRVFITSHYLQPSNTLTTLMIQAKVDPFYAAMCNRNKQWACRMSPKFVNGKPRSNDIVRRICTVNEDIRPIGRLEHIVKIFETEFKRWESRWFLKSRLEKEINDLCRFASRGVK